MRAHLAGAGAAVLANMLSDQYLSDTPQARTTAIKAGWICFGLGALTLWIFGIGMVFFSAAFIFGIVAMATNEVRRGLVLFGCSVAAIVLIPLSLMFLGLGVLGYAATKAQQRMEASAPGLRSLAKPPTPVSHVSPPSVRNSYAVPQPRQAVHDSLTSSVENFIRQARLSAVLSGNPAIAVINGKDYEVGQEVVIPSGARLRVTAIAQNSVYLRWQNQDFSIAIR
jgi:hypothetical protein